jgi:hypothetical protein
VPKTVLLPSKIIDAGDMSTNLTSKVTDIRYLDNIAIQLNWTGSPTGTFVIEGSLDYVPPPSAGGTAVNAGTWNAIPVSPTPAPAGSADSQLIELNQKAFPFIRTRYVKTSGTGTCNAYISGKAV